MTIALLSRVAIAALVLAVGCAGAPLALAQNRPAASVAIADPVADAIAEASRRFGVPQHWIRAVMRVESAGDRNAVSRAGAMGLMQVMPATYAELRRQYLDMTGAARGLIVLVTTGEIIAVTPSPLAAVAA